MGTAMLARCTILQNFGLTSQLAAAWYCEIDPTLGDSVNRAWAETYSSAFSTVAFRQVNRDVWDLLFAG